MPSLVVHSADKTRKGPVQQMTQQPVPAGMVAEA